MAVGKAAAWAMIAARTGDGRFGPFRFTDGTQIGEWRPTTPGVTDGGAWLKDIDPFFVRDPDRFRSRGPNALTSRAYAREYDEVKSLGRTISATRTPDQTDAARFWGTVNAVTTWTRLVRELAVVRPMAAVDRARFYALIYLTAADGAIATWRDKAEWSFWRPLTAIQQGDADGNPRTEGDPGWTSLITAPPYPDHASGLSAAGGAITDTARELLGTDRVEFGATVTPAVGAPVTRDYTRLSQAREEIVDARVWSGIHFRIADVHGAKIGRDVAARRAGPPRAAPAAPPLTRVGFGRRLTDGAAAAFT